MNGRQMNGWCAMRIEMRWVQVTDVNGRRRLEARWVVPVEADVVPADALPVGAAA